MLTKQKQQYRFYFHYHKGNDCWSVHFRGQCFPTIQELVCLVPCQGHIQKTQPRRIMRGFASEVLIHNNKAIIK